MPFAHAFTSMCYETNVNTKCNEEDTPYFLMSTKFDLANDNGPRSNFFSRSFYDKKKQKRSLVIDNNGRSSVSCSLSFFTMIIGQLRVNIKLLQSAFFFCQTDHSLSLFLIFFLLPYIKIYDIIVGAERKYRTTMFINLVPKKEEEGDIY